MVRNEEELDEENNSYLDSEYTMSDVEDDPTESEDISGVVNLFP
jgi:hypothetical protein